MANLIPLSQSLASSPQELITQLNDRLRRISESMNLTGTAGPQGQRGPPGMAGTVVPPGHDMEVFFNRQNKFSSDAKLTFDYRQFDLFLKGPAARAVCGRK